MESRFVGRQTELELLDDLWATQKATLLILYGRRRVGKTRLLTHWMKRYQGDALYWMAESTSALDQLRSFSQSLFTFAYPGAPLSSNFTYDSWEQALHQASLIAQERRFVLIIDEVTYILDVHPEFVRTLQKSWDHWLSKTNLFLALSGSQMGLMQQHLLDYQAPLYGRATATIKLQPLPFGATQQYFPTYAPLDRVKMYSVWGGIPAYWERLDAEMSVLGNLQSQLRTSNNWMMDEPRLLLQDFVNDPHNYVSIMRAIADGNQSLSEISKRIGLTGGSTSKYLGVLRDTGFVERDVPITKRGTESRQGRYFVTDPYLRFYYRFLSTYQSKIALGQQGQMLQEIEDDLPQFIANNTWQEMCRDWVLLATELGTLPVTITEIGSEWKRSFTLDIVGLDFNHKTFVLGDCCWENDVPIEDILSNLIKRTSAVLPDDDNEWSIYYLVFAINEWSDEERAEAATVFEKLLENNRGRKGWDPIGFRLVSLAEVDKDLTTWSANNMVDTGSTTVLH